MADVKFYDKGTQTSRIAGDYVRINRAYAPNPGGREDYKIDADDFLATEQALIATNTADIVTNTSDILTLQGLMSKTVNLNVTSNFTFTISADSIFWKVLFVWNSGTITVRLGTTLGGDEIMSDRTLSSTTTYKLTGFELYYGTLTTIYVTMSGGQMDMARFIQTSILT